MNAFNPNWNNEAPSISELEILVDDRTKTFQDVAEKFKATCFKIANRQQEEAIINMLASLPIAIKIYRLEENEAPIYYFEILTMRGEEATFIEALASALKAFSDLCIATSQPAPTPKVRKPRKRTPKETTDII